MLGVMAFLSSLRLAVVRHSCLGLPLKYCEKHNLLSVP